MMYLIKWHLTSFIKNIAKKRNIMVQEGGHASKWAVLHGSRLLQRQAAEYTCNGKGLSGASNSVTCTRCELCESSWPGPTKHCSPRACHLVSGLCNTDKLGQGEIPETLLGQSHVLDWIISTCQLSYVGL